MRKKKSEYEQNENRNYKHTPYGAKGNMYSGTDKSLVYSINKKSARQKGKKEIDFNLMEDKYGNFIGQTISRYEN